MSKVTRNKKILQKYLFILAIISFPVAQFCIFYIGVKIKSVLMAFQTYENGLFQYGAGFSNFSQFIRDIFKDDLMITCVKNSAWQYFVSVFVSTPIAICVAYFIWKAIPGSGFFKVVLMLPSMVSSVVFVLIVKNLVQIGGLKLTGDVAYANIFREEFNAILIYDIWIGFAGHLVLYLGAMSGVSVDVVEYGKIDGVNTTQELFHIVIPAIWPTITTFLVVGIAGFFTNMGARYSFFEYPLQDVPKKNWTLGFYFFGYAQSGSQVGGHMMYPYFSAGGLIFTLIATPTTLGAKWALEKFGPREQ